MELENHPLAAIVLMTVLGKNHQWFLNPDGESMMKNKILT